MKNKIYKSILSTISLSIFFSSTLYSIEMDENLTSNIKHLKKVYKDGKKIKKLFEVEKQIQPSKSLAVKQLEKVVPSLFIKNGEKIIAFIDGKAFKEISLLKHVSNRSVIMVSYKGAKAVYTVLDKGISYEEITSYVQTNYPLMVIDGAIIITPFPYKMLLQAGKYSVEKYIEIEKRSYIGLDDMLWDVPEEIEKKITLLNLEDTQRETVLDIEEIEEESIFEDKSESETILEENNEKKTILDF